MWLFVALTAQFILGTSAVFDKVLLRRRFGDPWAYTFWLGILGVLAVALVPFGVTLLPTMELLVALLAGALFLAALLLLFLALKQGEVSGTVPIIGGLTPVFTLLIGWFLLADRLGRGELIGFTLLVAGSFILFLSNGKGLRFGLLGLMITSAFLFGLSNVLTKIVFEASSFVTGFVWVKIGGVLFVLPPLLLASFRRKVLVLGGAFAGFNRFLYFSNRVYAGVGSVLVYVAIFLAHPALVDATKSFNYMVIFFVSWLWLGERFSGKALWGKFIATILIGAGVVWLALGV